MIIIDLLIQATIAIFIPYFIADRIFKKNGKKHSWPFWIFFFINWFAQAFLAVLLVHSMGQFETWLCDLSVFITPIIGYLIFKKNHNDIESNDCTQVNNDDTIQSTAANHNNDTLTSTPPLVEQSDSTQYEMIKKLKELYDFGALTEDEFLSKKAQILDNIVVPSKNEPVPQKSESEKKINSQVPESLDAIISQARKLESAKKMYEFLSQYEHTVPGIEEYIKISKEYTECERLYGNMPKSVLEKFDSIQNNVNSGIHSSCENTDKATISNSDSMATALEVTSAAHDEKVDFAYHSFIPEAARKQFPGGTQQVSIIVCSIAKLIGISTSTLDGEDYVNLLLIYLFVRRKKVFAKDTDEKIISNLQRQYGQYIKSNTIAQRVYAFCLLNLENNSLSVDDLDAMAALQYTNKHSAKNKENIIASKDAHSNNLVDPEYGLVPEKPIYTRGVIGSENYLRSLQTEQGESITWERRGCTSADGVDSLIDIYVISLLSGETYEILYIDMYGTENSTIAPKGFTFRA